MILQWYGDIQGVLIVYLTSYGVKLLLSNQILICKNKR